GRRDALARSRRAASARLARHGAHAGARHGSREAAEGRVQREVKQVGAWGGLRRGHGEAHAASLATCGQDLAAPFGGHARPEAMGLLTVAVARAEGALHGWNASLDTELGEK